MTNKEIKEEHDHEISRIKYDACEKCGWLVGKCEICGKWVRGYSLDKKK